MGDKRELRISAAVTEFEKLQVRRAAERIGTDEAGLIKQCLAIGVPLLFQIPYLQRVRLNDSDFFNPER